MAEIFTIVINRNDIGDTLSGLTSLTPYTTTVPINLYGGAYRVKLVSFAYNDGLANNATGSSHVNIYISSTRFNFPIQGNGNQLVFSNQNDGNSSASNSYQWRCNNPMGQLDISMYIQCFTDATFVKNNSALWSNTNFISAVLTLSFEPIESTN